MVRASVDLVDFAAGHAGLLPRRSVKPHDGQSYMLQWQRPRVAKSQLRYERADDGRDKGGEDEEAGL
jgi:hypothetical protein